MNIYSLEKFKINDDGTIELFDKTTVPMTTGIDLYKFIVTSEYEQRLDLVSKFLYGNPNYIEELMVLNNIINPLSIKSGDIILHPANSDDFNTMYQMDETENKQKDKILLMNKNKNPKSDPNRIGYPPTIKPDNLKQVNVDYDNKKVTIINKFK